MGILTEEAIERSSYAITLSDWTDAIGQTVTPDSLTWTLSTVDGSIINSREEVAATPAAEVVIVLSGDDLAFQVGESPTSKQWRIVTIEGEYDSSIGSGLALRDEYRFLLCPLVAVA